MRTILFDIWKHWASFQRLAWVPSPNLAMRFRSVLEYFWLWRLQRKILKPGGLQAEMKRVLQEAPPNQRCVTFQEAQSHLIACRQAAWVHPTALCLAKSLRALQILQDAGICGENIRFRIGIRRAAIGFTGHAWVTCDGVPLLEDPFEEDECEQVWDAAELLVTSDKVTSPTQSPGYQIMDNSHHSALTYRVKEGVLVYAFDEEEAVAFDLAEGVCFGLNGYGYRVWQNLAAGREVEESVRQITTETRADVEIVRADVREFISHLRAAGLVQAECPVP